MMTLEKKGLVLLAHGSRDPSWGLGISAIAEALCTPNQLATCAYIELSSPTLLEAVQHLHAQRCQHIEIVPMFLGLGQHARHDLPRLLAEAQAAMPSLRLSMQPALCDRPQFISALAALLKAELPPQHTASSSH